jgi:hypothetical protein
MDIGNYIAIPSALAAIIGVIAIFILIGRKDQQLMDHTSKLKDHGDTLKECGKKNTVTIENCRVMQDACIRNQREANERIIADIADVKNELQMNRRDIFGEIREDKESVHKELIKLNNIVGEINGLVGRLRFDGDGRIIP